MTAASKLEAEWTHSIIEAILIMPAPLVSVVQPRLEKLQSTRILQAKAD
jgi:hypothetical protein